MQDLLSKYGTEKNLTGLWRSDIGTGPKKTETLQLRRKLCLISFVSLERKPLNSTRTLVSHKLDHSLIEPSEKRDNVTISQKLSKQE